MHVCLCRPKPIDEMAEKLDAMMGLTFKHVGGCALAEKRTEDSERMHLQATGGGKERRNAYAVASAALQLARAALRRVLWQPPPTPLSRGLAIPRWNPIRGPPAGGVERAPQRSGPCAHLPFHLPPPSAYLRRVSSGDLDGVVRVLIRALMVSLLRTHRSKFTQFVLFFVCAKDSSLKAAVTLTNGLVRDRLGGAGSKHRFRMCLTLHCSWVLLCGALGPQMRADMCGN